MRRRPWGCVVLLFFLMIGGAALYYQLYLAGPALYRYHVFIRTQAPNLVVNEQFIDAPDLDTAIIEAKQRFCSAIPCEIVDDKAVPKRVR